MLHKIGVLRVCHPPIGNGGVNIVRNTCILKLCCFKVSRNYLTRGTLLCMENILNHDLGKGN